ncbi:DNA (cytosine-5)-methyltransferase 1 [Robiginitalea myxolifaciens]|uniref:Cytosine-specific methyltransferase n=1 Tax=Robiginitalea myxolifaciens TaxID=400055 RepID=A0A1I6G0U1_9FLAO|nr:DNA (cytosine-5-)-methyltransferase [Robiginitalea myxolifaciens]SFR35833.1 DNA (cytosine-5)-methyltransferase 1 [Robiginitalea myxolifaciens]
MEKLEKIAERINPFLQKDKYAGRSAEFTHFISNLDNPARGLYRGGAYEFIMDIAEEIEPELELSTESIETVLDIYLHNYKPEPPFQHPKSPEFTFIDLFAGIGGFRLALQGHGGKSVFSSEWDKYSKKTYLANYGELPFGDITKVDEKDIPDHDVLLAGFPCQPFSLAGVSKKNSLGRNHGFLDETQGTLFFDIARIIKEKRPKAFILENVKNLRSHDKGRTFAVIMDTLDKLNYQVSADILDAKYYVPQHRERIFIVGFDRNTYNPDMKFSFPEQNGDPIQLVDSNVLAPVVDKKYTLSDKLWGYLKAYAEKHRQKGNGFGFGLADPYGVTRTLSARYHKDGSEILVSQGKKMNPRRLTPEECRRLMGFPEEFRIKDTGVSDTQLYRQFGNSVAVPVVEAVAGRVIEHMKNSLLNSENMNDTEVNEPIEEDSEHRFTA